MALRSGWRVRVGGGWGLVGALVAVLALGCGARPAPAPPGWEGAAELLAQVPADTPYLLASLADPPPALRDRELARLGPALQGLATALLSQGAVAGAQSPFLRLVLALAAGLDGKLEAPGEALGLGASPRFAVFGLQGLPAVRAVVADGHRLEAVVDQVLADAGLQVDHEVLGGQQYRVIGVGDLPLLYVAFGPRWVAAGVLLPPVRAALLPVLLGQVAPEKSIDLGGLQAELAADGRLGQAVGWLRPAALLTEGWPLTRVLAAGAPPGCVAGLRRRLAPFEGLRFGLRAASAEETRWVVQVALAPALAAAVAAVARPAPGLALGASGRDRAALAVGVALPQAAAAVRAWAAEEAAAEDGCPWFARLHEVADTLSGPVGARLLAAVPAVEGGAVTLNRLQLGGEGPPGVAGAAWLAGESQPLFALLGDAVPGARALAEAPADEVVPLALPPPWAQRFPEAHGVRRADGLGLAVGAEGRSRLEGLARLPAPTGGPALLWHVDLRFLEARDQAEDQARFARAPALAAAFAALRGVRRAGARAASALVRVRPEGLEIEGFTRFAAEE